VSDTNANTAALAPKKFANKSDTGKSSGIHIDAVTAK
jgi:hypothetical protein